ncbi:type II toxin-antitoxin system RelE/ParE family toxin [Stutzerimonas kirkiae]|uniref:Type II toxin-antitoxin system RelE/ParE family toxin n=1 Tax=Stutzerimonas kirkiae TaxID=2211392 RepID=A0A4Q9R0K2_9GAMM|nr:type II toxin-antitoxin system RelE/ParE family toxin [Stutzerimonas kirkiae]TBU90061.1 type II toxin-antitoxin system RelE/ParE family toxin [Stutzerimonas kirkiae]TBU98218.1 type II toxin-antitoxin system RelE/ParE family toxin [Stutzerimonas kirkiae]TBV10186.1 type II toxin-antitoxin system RelE/ParE family toxin [Stutzerimonas kirkiae]
MAVRIELAPEVADDFERILEHLERHQASRPDTRIEGILEAFNLLETSPLIGRPAGNGKRELVIGQGSQGYVALYRYLAEMETVFVLAIRGQREAGFSHPDDE